MENEIININQKVSDTLSKIKALSSVISKINAEDIEKETIGWICELLLENALELDKYLRLLM